MSHLDEEQRKLNHELSKGHMYEGVVVADLSTADQLISIRLPDQDKAFGPMPWPERGMLMPSRGDRALMTISDDDQYWCVGWWPYD